MLLGEQAEELGYERSYAVYVSHPISRPRRMCQEEGKWPGFVEELNTFVSALRGATVDGAAVVPVMPTAIDELRLLEDGTYIQPALTARWPLPQEESMFSLPEAPQQEPKFAGYEDYERRGLCRIFDPPIDRTGRRAGLPLPDPEVSGVLRALKESIRLQMAGRDHFLVRQCPGLFLYRPVYRKGEFSGGVDAEVKTFANTRGYETKLNGTSARRAVFLHDVADADVFFSRDDTTKKEEYGASAVRAVVDKLGQKAEAVVEEANVGIRPQPADPKHVATALRVYGDPAGKMRPIYDDLFPEQGRSAIGQPVSLEWERVRSVLTEVLLEGRARVLAHGVEGSFYYTYSEDHPVYKSGSSGSEAPDLVENYVEVIRGLDGATRAGRAATRVRQFLVRGSAGSED